MADYTPPPSTRIPFVFSGTSYAKPNFGPLLFNFKSVTPANLSAAINVIQHAPYREEAYTYLKGCPTYVVGYSSLGIQVLKGKCLYGGIRDLTASILGFVLVLKTSDLSASIGRVFPKDLSSAIATHPPRDIAAAIRVWRSTQKDLSTYLHPIYIKNLGGVLEGTHNPVDLSAFLKVASHGETNLTSSIHAWYEKYLTAYMRPLAYSNLQSTVLPIPAAELWAYIKAIPQQDLLARVRVWGYKELSATIGHLYTEVLLARINPVVDTTKDVYARIKGFGDGYLNLSANMLSYSTSTLPANVRATYFNDISAYMFLVQPKHIRASIHGYAEKFLSAQISPAAWPWNLTAYINVTGNYKDISAYVVPQQAIGVYKNITAQIKSWLSVQLSANIYGDNAHVLYAYINCVGRSSDLHAAIRPKVIRLTTVIDVSTMTKMDLSATINYLCFKTGYSNLNSAIYVKYMRELSSYVRGISIPTLKDLPAKVGYSDSYSVVDKLKLCISVYPSNYRVEDKLRLVFSVFRAANLLGAYIKGTLRYHSLSASIAAQEIDHYYYSAPIKNRERVINTTYDGIFKSFEVVEFAFQNMVKDYYYSSDGDYAWKSNRLERWILDVKSYIPVDISLNIKRKLHKATKVYDLRRFRTIDEAVKYAINYVTEYPKTDLAANLLVSGGFRGLTSTLIPRLPITTKTNISATVVPIGGEAASNIILSVGGNIVKI